MQSPKRFLKGSTLILDNATFHRSSDVEKIMKKMGCYVKFLPPYSPDFNKIENYWSPVKNDLRKKFRIMQEYPLRAVWNTLKNRSN